MIYVNPGCVKFSDKHPLFFAALLSRVESQTCHDAFEGGSVVTEGKIDIHAGMKVAKHGDPAFALHVEGDMPGDASQNFTSRQHPGNPPALWSRLTFIHSEETR